MITKILHDWNDVISLSKEWDDLLSHSTNNSIFLRWDWIETWWNHYRKNAKPYIVTVRNPEGKIQGIAPMMLNDCPGTLGIFKVLQIIGHGSDVYPEYLDWIIHEKNAEQVAAQIGTILLARHNADWHAMDLQLVPENSPALEVVRKWPYAFKCCLEINIKKSFHLPLPFSFEEFQQARGMDFRKRWRKKNNHLKKAGAMRIAVAGHDVSVEEALSILIELNKERWGDKGKSFRSQEFISFHHDLCRRFSYSNMLSLVIMYINEIPVAARYDFIHDNKFWGYQSGWSLKWQEYSVSYILLGRVLERGIQMGLTEYDFMAGDSEYKNRWAEGSRNLIDLSFYKGPGLFYLFFKKLRYFSSFFLTFRK